MNDDELARLLSDAFDAHARGAVSDARNPPPPRFASAADASAASTGAGQGGPAGLVGLAEPRAARRRAASRLALPLSAAAAVVVLVGLVLALVGHGSGTSGHPQHQAVGGSPAATPIDRAALRGTGAPVHIKLLNADGQVVGVGMPVIAYFSKKITDARALQDVTTVTVDGVPTTADWYFERSNAIHGYPYEAHLRPRTYWPADARVHVGIATRGLTAGTGLRFDDSLTLGFRTGARHVLTVDERTNRLTFDDGGTLVNYRVSLGAPATPTDRGVKVIMQKGVSICMSGPGYDQCGIKYTQRLTQDGEYLHAAPWNRTNIDDGIDSSNGCTNLLPKDAARLYRLLRVGDVVDYPDADGPMMQLGNGFGDWNVPWTQWRTGGLVRTH